MNYKLDGHHGEFIIANHQNFNNSIFPESIKIPVNFLNHIWASMAHNMFVLWVWEGMGASLLSKCLEGHIALLSWVING